MSRRYVGERVLQKCGEYAELIELLQDYMCKVKFDSGVEKVCSRQKFGSGDVASSNKRIFSVGDRFLQKCGEYAEIVELLSNARCKVRFDSGFERECQRGHVSNGNVSNKGISYRRVGERILQKCGEYAEIIELLEEGKCRIKFDNGAEVRCNRNLFNLGLVAYNSRAKRSIGEKVTQNCGAVAELVEFKENGECLVKFIDGYTCISNKGRFAKGSVMHPLIRYGGGTYIYKNTSESILSMYFDERIKHYVMVLRRTDGTRYVRVLGGNKDE